MLGDAVSTDTATLPPRAGIALLTLQLRAALQDAAAADALDVEADPELARAELRARLEPLIEQRRQALATALAHARDEATDTVAAARRAATVMATRASPTVAEVEAPVAEVAPLSTVGFAPPDVESLPPVEEILTWFADPGEPDDLAGPAVLPDPVLPDPVLPDTVLPDTVLPDTVLPHLVVAPPAVVPLAATNLVIEAEELARAIALAFATVLDERFPTWGAGLPAGSAFLPALVPAAAPPAPKPSFWTHARHPDVLLIGLATIIVLVIVAAWMA